MSTGSLGTGLSTAQGMALAARVQGWDETRVYATSSDGGRDPVARGDALLPARTRCWGLWGSVA